MRPEALPTYLPNMERFLTSFSPDQARLWPVRFADVWYGTRFCHRFVWES